MKRTSLILTLVLGLFMLLTITAGISYAVSQADGALIRKIDGRKYTYKSLENDGNITTYVLDVRGNVFVWGYIEKNVYFEIHRSEIRGRETTLQNQYPNKLSDCNCWLDYYIYTISDDCETITQLRHFTDGDTRKDIYFWQR